MRGDNVEIFSNLTRCAHADCADTNLFLANDYRDAVTNRTAATNTTQSFLKDEFETLVGALSTFSSPIETITILLGTAVSHETIDNAHSIYLSDICTTEVNYFVLKAASQFNSLFERAASEMSNLLPPGCESVELCLSTFSSDAAKGNSARYHGEPLLLKWPNTGQTIVISISALSQMRRRKEEKGNASFSRTLYLAKCCTDSIDHSRWETDKVTHNLNPSGKLPKFSGLLCRNISNFDAELYLVSLRELQSMDPQQRLLLDIVGESLGVNLINFNNEHCATKTIRSPGTSVVLGISWVDFQNVSTCKQIEDRYCAHSATGMSLSVGAGRIAYTYNFSGMACTIDTACSSSLVALCVGADSVRLQNSDCTVIGTVNLILSPEISLHFHAAQMLCDDGRCKTFDYRADGYVRSEACNLIICSNMQTMSIREMLEVQCRGIKVILQAAKVNQDGRSNGLTAPNGMCQKSLFACVIHQSFTAVQMIDLCKVHTHGTGTALGDPIETSSVFMAVYGILGLQSCPTICFSAIKSSIGHSEASSGADSFSQAVNQMAASTAHGISHLTCLNCHVEDTVKAQAGHAQFNKSHMTATLPSHYSNKITIAVVNSFAFQGTNSMANITSESNWCEPKIYYHYAKQIVYQALAVQLQTGFKPDCSIFDGCFHLSASFKLSPMLAEMFDHGVHGHAILPGTAHVEFSRAAITQVKSARPIGETGMCSVVFAAPLALDGAGLVQCRVDHFGRFQLMALSARGRQRARSGLRSSGSAALIQNTFAFGIKDGVDRHSMTSRLVLHGVRAPEHKRRAVDTPLGPHVKSTNMSLVSLSRIHQKNHERSDSGTIFEKSPAMLDANIHQGVATMNMMDENKNDHCNSAAKCSRHTAKVPAAIKAAAAKGQERQYTSTWSAVSAEATESYCQQMTISNHRLWSSSRAASVSADINGLESRTMRQPDLRLGFKHPPVKCQSRETSLTRTLYFSEWQSRGGLAHLSDATVGVVPYLEVRTDSRPKNATRGLTHLKTLCTSSLSGHNNPDSSIAMSTMSVPQQSAAGLIELLQGARGASQAMQNHGIHIQTCNGTSTARFEGCMPVDVRAGALSQGALGIMRSSMQEGGLRGDMSFSDSDARECTRSPLRDPGFAVDRLGVRHGGAVLTERLLASSATTNKTQSCDGLSGADRAMISVSGHSTSRGRHQCIVTGGLGGLGGLASAWLFQSGSRTLRLTGRSGRTPMKPHGISSLRLGHLRCVRSDVGCSEDVKCGFGRNTKRAILDPLVLGLVHSGGALFDAPTSRHCLRSMRGVWAGKASGAGRLLRNDVSCADATRWQSHFSSVAALLGSPAQCMYSAANAFLDATSECMRRQGRVGSTIQWGAWAASGMATKSAQTLSRTVRAAAGAIAPESGLAALGLLVECSCTYPKSVAGVSPIGLGALASTSVGVDAASRIREYRAILPIDRADWSIDACKVAPDNTKMIERALSMKYDNFVTNKPTFVSDAKPANIHSTSLPIPSAHLVHRDICHLVAGAIKGVAGRSVHEDAPLMEEGLDSLSAVELGNALQDAVGIPMPATLVFDYPSATAIVAYIQNATDEAARDVDALDDTRQATWGQRCESVENNGIIRSDDEHLVFFRKLLVSNTAESLDSEVDDPLATALVQSALETRDRVSDSLAANVGSSLCTAVSLIERIVYVTSPTCRSAEDRIQYSSAEDACGLLPAGRFEYDTLDTTSPASFVPRLASVIEDVELFEANVFRISEAEMDAMDPQQRCLLEAVLESNALSEGDADSTRAEIAHRNKAHFGVFVGASQQTSYCAIKNMHSNTTSETPAQDHTQV